MFYDVRAGKYLESSINASRTVVLKASKGYVVSVLFELSTTIFDKILFVYSSQKKKWMGSNKSNMFQLFTHTVMTIAAPDYFQLAAHYLLIWLAIMQEFGSEISLDSYFK